MAFATSRQSAHCFNGLQISTINTSSTLDFAYGAAAAAAASQELQTSTTSFQQSNLEVRSEGGGEREGGRVRARGREAEKARRRE